VSERQAPTRPMTIPELVESVNQRVEEFRRALIADLENTVVVLPDESEAKGDGDAN
jgi:hypothetical protein